MRAKPRLHEADSLAPIFADPALDPASRTAALASGGVDQVLLLQGGETCHFIAHQIAMQPDHLNLPAGPSDHPAVVMDLSVIKSA